MRRLALAFLGIYFIWLGACGWDTPIPATPAPGQPCGPIDVVCQASDGTVAGCCDQNDTCGGSAFGGCPAGMCCFVGSEGYAAKKPYAQRPARTQ